jgi:hypothetical protein
MTDTVSTILAIHGGQIAQAGMSVLEAAKDLNNQSIGFKMKNLLGTRG